MGKNRHIKHNGWTSYPKKKNLYKILFWILISILIAYFIIQNVEGLKTSFEEIKDKISVVFEKKDIVTINLGIPCGMKDMNGAEANLCDMNCGDLKYVKYSCSNANWVICHCEKNKQLN